MGSSGRVLAAVGLLVGGGLLELFGIYSYVTKPNQTYGPLDFVFGPLLVASGIIQLVVGPTAFRKGSKWAWYLVLFVVLVGLANVVYDWPYLGGFAVALFPAYGGLALVALILTYGKFFSKQSSVGA